jgi:hydroxypyruvate isomerase
MARFTANISFLFRELPFLERFAAAAAAGFAAVECHDPCAHPVDELRRAIADAGVRLTGINVAPGPRAGDFGLACDPARRDDFLAGVRQALAYAAALDVPAVHVLAGVVPDGGRDAARASYLAAMAEAADLAARDGRMILTEPLNSRDRPGYFISRSDKAVALIEAIGRPNLKLMFDVYHVQIMEGDVTRRLRRHFPHIGHVQIAGVPDRQEPDRGEIDYRHVLRTLADLRYEGWIGCEYAPAGRTAEGLGWMTALA